VLLFVRRYEMIETEFHHRYMEKISRLYGQRLAKFEGYVQSGLEYLLVVNFQTRQYAACEIILKESKPA